MAKRFSITVAFLGLILACGFCLPGKGNRQNETVAPGRSFMIAGGPFIDPDGSTVESQRSLTSAEA